MAFPSSGPMVRDPKAGAELSESEQSCIPVRTVADGGSRRLWCCGGQRLVLLTSVLCLLSLEFATLRVAHWSSIRKELKRVEGKNAALETNLTAMANEELNSEEQLALVESEMQLRTEQCGQLQRDLQLREEENFQLRRNVSGLTAEQALASKELAERRRELEAASAQGVLLRVENDKLQANLTWLQEQRQFLQEDLDSHYKEFLVLRAAMHGLRQQNGDLKLSVSAADDEVSALRLDVAEERNESHKLVNKSSVPFSNLSRAEHEESREAEQGEVASEEESQEAEQGEVASEELKRRYRQFVDMSQNLETLRNRNAQLEADVQKLTGKKPTGKQLQD